ncbi:unnamed protein product [Ambrosiozyma monospora]|uniref:Unnamed protein product n=1 Tax=Ambrosiozyma monospora TaxID=43982 RepID=A0ACB5T584_AMBMO|nr:unnamed protein product [Ambrosiozyma monospora]
MSCVVDSQSEETNWNRTSTNPPVNMSFKDQHKQLSRNFKDEVQKDEFELTCSIIEFANKFLINVSKNGEIDTSFDVQLPTEQRRMNHYNYDEYDVEDDDADGSNMKDINEGVMANVLIGNNANMKNQVLATQVGKLVNQFNPQKKNSLILNVSGKIFAKSENATNDDFTRLNFVLELIKDCFNVRA